MMFDVFFGGLRVVGVIMQFVAILAIAVIGIAVIVSSVCFVIGGILNAWEKGDDGEPSKVEKQWKGMFGGEVDDGVYYPPPPPPPQNVRRNLCHCRSCAECDAERARGCPARKCEVCTEGKVWVTDRETREMVEKIRETGKTGEMEEMKM